MRGVIKQNCPTPLATWLALGGANWTPTYGDFRGPYKTGTHDALLAEQMGLCVYCGRALSRERHDSHIDHFRPQAKFNAENPPDLSLSYENLVVSCGPNKFPLGHPQRCNATCGEAKDDWFDNGSHIDPTDQSCQKRFAYGMTGGIFAASTEDLAAEVMIGILNLNEKTLSYDRAIILQGIEKDISDGIINLANMAGEIASFRGPNSDGFASNLSHVAARYIEDAF